LFTVLTTNQKGAIAEMAIAHEAARLGIAFAAYCRETGRCYFATIRELAGRNQLMLRLDPTRNNQLAGVNWAKDFEFAAKLVAVLGP
jgi:hypothetical protein